jgi:hypothetical protein
MDIVPCHQQEPLSKLQEDGEAAILNYNLPQSTTYEVVSHIQLDVAAARFKDTERKAPAGNYWERLDRERSEDRFSLEAIQAVVRGNAYTSLSPVQNLGLNLASNVSETRRGVVFKAGNIPVPTKSTEFSVDYLANRINDDFRPVLYKRPSGKQGLRFAPRPKAPQPSIFIVLHMKMATYAGDYGAGTTLKTFSLLPREKTVIEIRDYRHQEETRSSSQSVMDSYSESCMDDLQTTIEERTEKNESSSETDTDSMSADMSVSGGFNLGIVKAGADVSGSASSVNTTEEAVSSSVETLESAVSHHVQTADSARQIEINTDVTTSSTTENETTTIRTLENINSSRVLNFVFRQLLQEFFTLTYLHDVSFYYSNGYDNSVKRGTLGGLDNFLAAILKDEAAIKEVRTQIYITLCNIPDSTGTRTRFIEKVAVKATNCIEPGAGEKEVSYVRKRKDLKQSYRGKTVDGIILRATDRVMRTPAVIVDALMGEGDAHDCFNNQLQQASYVGAHLANAKTEQAMAIIDGIEDPLDKAKLYNSVFGTCCSTPQAETEEA